MSKNREGLSITATGKTDHFNVQPPVLSNLFSSAQAMGRTVASSELAV
jgi:hypothetical protein